MNKLRNKHVKWQGIQLTMKCIKFDGFMKCPITIFHSLKPTAFLDPRFSSFLVR